MIINWSVPIDWLAYNSIDFFVFLESVHFSIIDTTYINRIEALLRYRCIIFLLGRNYRNFYSRFGLFTFLRLYCRTSKFWILWLSYYYFDRSRYTYFLDKYFWIDFLNLSFHLFSYYSCFSLILLLSGKLRVSVSILTLF